MSTETLRQSLSFVLSMEGGYVNNPADPGGETKWGISKRQYPNLDIRNLTPEQALQIYQRDYWNPVGGDNLFMPVCVVALDCAVMCGVNAANYWLRKWGSSWLDIINERRKYFLRIVDQRPASRVFLKGWLNRNSQLTKFCENWDQSNDVVFGP